MELARIYNGNMFGLRPRQPPQRGDLGVPPVASASLFIITSFLGPGTLRRT